MLFCFVRSFRTGSEWSLFPLKILMSSAVNDKKFPVISACNNSSGW